MTREVIEYLNIKKSKENKKSDTRLMIDMKTIKKNRKERR